MYSEFYQNPPTFERIRRAAYELKSSYPCLKVFSVGRSVLGRTLYAIGIGPLKGATLFAGGFHGMEWLTSLMLFRFCEDLARALTTGQPLADIDITDAFENRSLLVVPCVNPDGVEISLGGPQAALSLTPLVERVSCGDTSHWQANARGVDLNHNYDAGWQALHQMEQQEGICGPGPTRYGGPRPHSEPETMAMVNLCRAFQVRQVYAFHSQGEEIYYRYGRNTPARSQLMAEVLASSCGYTVAAPTGLASHGGFKDWFIEKYRRPGFTFEIGRGENPLPIEDLEPIYARLIEALLLAVLI